MNEGINLLDPNKQGSVSNELLKRLKTMRLVVVGLLFIISVSSAILFMLVALSPLPALRKQQDTLQQNLSLVKNDMIKYELVNQRTTDIATILTRRRTIDTIISQVENVLPSDSSVTALQLQAGAITVTAESPSLDSLNNYLDGLMGYVQNKKNFSQVDLTELAIDATNNEYSVTVQLIPL